MTRPRKVLQAFVRKVTLIADDLIIPEDYHLEKLQRILNYLHFRREEMRFYSVPNRKPVSQAVYLVNSKLKLLKKEIKHKKHVLARTCSVQYHKIG